MKVTWREACLVREKRGKREKARLSANLQLLSKEWNEASKVDPLNFHCITRKHWREKRENESRSGIRSRIDLIYIEEQKGEQKEEKGRQTDGSGYENPDWESEATHTHSLFSWTTLSTETKERKREDAAAEHQFTRLLPAIIWPHDLWFVIRSKGRSRRRWM